MDEAVLGEDGVDKGAGAALAFRACDVDDIQAVQISRLAWSQYRSGGPRSGK